MSKVSQAGGRARSELSGCPALVRMGLLTAVGTAVGMARADDFTVTGSRYHYQVNDHYCVSATVQMILDSAAVRGSNPYINQFLTAADPAGSPALIPAQPTYVGGQVTFAPQVAIYNLIHGMATYTPTVGPLTGVPLGYNNPFTPWPTAGSGNNAVQWALNVLDNPTVGGNGNHAYTAYNVPATIAWGDFASRTIVNAIHDYDVPAQATIGSGAHSIAVTGYTTVGTPGRNQAYNITGLYVRDPWTGYVLNEIANGRPAPAGGLGLGTHAWLKYGYSLSPTAPPVFIPGVGVVNARPNEWFRSFNPAPGQLGEGAYMTGPGFKFVVEPLGPEELDDGNGGLLDSIPNMAALLPTALDAAGALAAATSGLAGSDFADEWGLSDGAFDTDTAHIMLMDGDDEADWLVPYLKDGQYTGAVLVNSYTGEIMQATWFDEGGEFDAYTLGQLESMYTNLYDDIFPVDNPVPVPEPGAVGAALVMGGTILGSWVSRRRRNRASAAT